MNERRLRILVIDDEPAHLELLSRGLGFEGFEVAILTGPIGITHLVRTFQPDVALVDLHIPGSRGDRVIQLIRNVAPPDIKYFLISSCPESELRLRALETKAHGWLSKSLTTQEIAHRIKEALGKPRGISANMLA